MDRDGCVRIESQARRTTVDMKHSTNYFLYAVTQSCRIRGKSFSGTQSEHRESKTK